MAKRKIPAPPRGVYRWILRREFDGAFYRMLFYWNVRAGSWFFDLANDAGEVKVRGVRMNLGKDKLRPFKYDDVPQGSLDVVDSTGQFVEPGIEDLGDRVQIEYVEPS